MRNAPIAAASKRNRARISTMPSRENGDRKSFSLDGLAGVGSRHWERGRPARNAARKRGDTLILAFSRKGRRDPLTAIRT